MRKVQSADCAGAILGGDAASDTPTFLNARAEKAITVCAAGGEIREWPAGTESCETGAGLPGETLQQVVLSFCACAVDSGVAALCAIIGQPGAQVCAAPFPPLHQQLDRAAAGPARSPISTSTAMSLKRRLTNHNPREMLAATVPTCCDASHIRL